MCKVAGAMKTLSRCRFVCSFALLLASACSVSGDGLCIGGSCAPENGVCPWEYPLTGIYDCTGQPDSCYVPSWEWGDIPCTCDDTQMGICCGSDNLDACPSTVQDGTLCCVSDESCPQDSEYGGSPMCTCTSSDGSALAYWRCSADGGVDLSPVDFSSPAD
jgi:hypothetical protein